MTSLVPSVMESKCIGNIPQLAGHGSVLKVEVPLVKASCIASPRYNKIARVVSGNGFCREIVDIYPPDMLSAFRSFLAVAKRSLSLTCWGQRTACVGEQVFTLGLSSVNNLYEGQKMIVRGYLKDRYVLDLEGVYHLFKRINVLPARVLSERHVQKERNLFNWCMGQMMHQVRLGDFVFQDLLSDIRGRVGWRILPVSVVRKMNAVLEDMIITAYNRTPEFQYIPNEPLERYERKFIDFKGRVSQFDLKSIKLRSERHSLLLSVNRSFVYNYDVLRNQMIHGGRVKVVTMFSVLGSSVTTDGNMVYRDLGKTARIDSETVVFRPCFIEQLRSRFWLSETLLGTKDNTSMLVQASMCYLLSNLLPRDMVRVIWGYWFSFSVSLDVENLNEDTIGIAFQKRFWWILRGFVTSSLK